MLADYPILQTFFKKNSFTDEELVELELIIDERYKDHRENKKAKELIKRELLKFKLMEQHGSRKRPPKSKSSKPNSTTKTKENIDSPKFTMSNASLKAKREKVYLAANMNKLKNATFRQAAEILGLSTEFLLKTVRSKGVMGLSQTSKIDHRIYRGMEDYFLETLKENFRIQYYMLYPNKDFLQEINLRTPSDAPGAYGNVEKHGLGKLIYIRSK